MQHLLTNRDNTSVSEHQREAMEAFCTYLGKPVPCEFRMCPVNAVAVLIHWKAVFLFVAQLEPKQQEYLRKAYPVPEQLLPMVELRHVLVLHCRGIPDDSGVEAYFYLLHLVRRHVSRSQRIYLHCFTGDSYALDQWWGL
ncbi:uncharacterized protein LOC143288280 [Babylonia areolata]|uniref:uncharacterized protein LOC143288280 n=1 Tax=Babylonia areolata TaxID=304850 RepID=UPI003FD60C4B